MVFAAALLPFLAATVYMSVKPAPKRIPRTHGGSALTAPDAAQGVDPGVAPGASPDPSGRPHQNPTPPSQPDVTTPDAG